LRDALPGRRRDPRHDDRGGTDLDLAKTAERTLDVDDPLLESLAHQSRLCHPA